MKQIRVRWVGVVGVLIAAAVAVVVAVWGFDHHWGSSQWGPVASWMSSAFAMIAVTVAVIQTVLTRREAEAQRVRHGLEIAANEKQHEKEMARTDERHTEQLDHARKLLEQQFDAGKQERELQAIKGIAENLSVIMSRSGKFLMESINRGPTMNTAKDVILVSEFDGVVDTPRTTATMLMLDVQDKELAGAALLALNAGMQYVTHVRSVATGAKNVDTQETSDLAKAARDANGDFQMLALSKFSPVGPPRPTRDA